MCYTRDDLLQATKKNMNEMAAYWLNKCNADVFGHEIEMSKNISKYLSKFNQSLLISRLYRVFLLSYPRFLTFIRFKIGPNVDIFTCFDYMEIVYFDIKKYE